jgi:predicted ATPase
MQALPYLKQIRILREKIEDQDIYPFNLPVIRNFESLDFHPSVTFIIGENGAGKSTLIEAIALLMDLNAEGGSKNFKFSSYESYSTLYKCLRPSRGISRPKDSYFLRAESFYNVATEIEKLDQGPGGPPIKESYGGKSLHNQSHGESFWSLLNHRLRGKGFYIFDEPESALSPARQLAALARIHDLVQMDSQFIIATHSPILLAYPDAVIYEIKDGSLYKTDYEQTEHYQITHAFLNNYDTYLKILMEDPSD